MPLRCASRRGTNISGEREPSRGQDVHLRQQRPEAGRSTPLKTFVESDLLLRHFFTLFLFEDLPAADARVHMACTSTTWTALHIGLFGKNCGFEETEGLPPTRAGVRPRHAFKAGRGSS